MTATPLDTLRQPRLVQEGDTFLVDGKLCRVDRLDDDDIASHAIDQSGPPVVLTMSGRPVWDNAIGAWVDSGAAAAA